MIESIPSMIRGYFQLPFDVFVTCLQKNLCEKTTVREVKLAKNNNSIFVYAFQASMKSIGDYLSPDHDVTNTNTFMSI